MEIEGRKSEQLDSNDLVDWRPLQDLYDKLDKLDSQLDNDMAVWEQLIDALESEDADQCRQALQTATAQLA